MDYEAMERDRKILRIRQASGHIMYLANKQLDEHKFDRELSQDMMSIIFAAEYIFDNLNAIL